MATDSAACDIFQQRVLAALTRAGLPSNFQSTETTGLDVALTTINSMSPVTFAELVRDLYGANLVLKGGVLSDNPMFYTSSVMSTGNTQSKMKDAMALIRQAMIQGGCVVPALDSYQSNTFDKYPWTGESLSRRGTTGVQLEAISMSELCQNRSSRPASRNTSMLLDLEHAQQRDRWAIESVVRCHPRLRWTAFDRRRCTGGKPGAALQRRDSAFPSNGLWDVLLFAIHWPQARPEEGDHIKGIPYAITESHIATKNGEDELAIHSNWIQGDSHAWRKDHAYCVSGWITDSARRHCRPNDMANGGSWITASEVPSCGAKYLGHWLYHLQLEDLNGHLPDGVCPDSQGNLYLAEEALPLVLFKLDSERLLKILLAPRSVNEAEAGRNLDMIPFSATQIMWRPWYTKVPSCFWVSSFRRNSVTFSKMSWLLFGAGLVGSWNSSNPCQSRLGFCSFVAGPTPRGYHPWWVISQTNPFGRGSA